MHTYIHTTYIHRDRKIKIFFVYCYFEINVLCWCPFAHLFDAPFQNSPYGHACVYL